MTMGITQPPMYVDVFNNMDIKEIIQAWSLKISAPNDVVELAEKRATICKNCEHAKQGIKGKDWTYYCGKCGCPIAGKTFSPKQNPCPLEKWEEVDKEYFSKKVKTTKTLI